MAQMIVGLGQIIISIRVCRIDGYRFFQPGQSLGVISGFHDLSSFFRQPQRRRALRRRLGSNLRNQGTIVRKRSGLASWGGDCTLFVASFLRRGRFSLRSCSLILGSSAKGFGGLTGGLGGGSEV